MQDIIIYDALSITSNIHQVSDIIDIIGMHDVPWQTVPGAKGFQYRMYYDCVSIHFGRDDDFVWLELTGQGCRVFETFGTGDYESLFALALDNPGNVKLTRLDVAYDDHSGILDIDTLCNDTRQGNFISRFCDWQVIEGSKGQSITHGSMQSEIFLRIYDKAAERKITDGTHWVRVELQLRRDRAMQFVQSSGDIGSRFRGVLLNYVRYIVSDGIDSNRWRWDMLSYWSTLVAAADKLSVYVKPGTEYNMARMTNYVYNQAGNAIDATIQILGVDGFLQELHGRGTKPNPKYKMIVDECKRERTVTNVHID